MSAIELHEKEIVGGRSRQGIDYWLFIFKKTGVLKAYIAFFGPEKGDGTAEIRV